MRSIADWNIPDPYPEKELGDIIPISARAAALIARNKSSETLQGDFLRIQGFQDMMEGLDYHYNNFKRTERELAYRESAKLFDTDKGPNHEMVAYFNRLGQIYYFLNSKHCRERGISPEQAPTIVHYLPFRHKHSAHRSMDCPENESDDQKWYQAWVFSGISGSMTMPKPGAKEVLPPTSIEDMDRHRRESFEYRSRAFQIPVKGTGDWLMFIPDIEHSKIVSECFQILEKLV